MASSPRERNSGVDLASTVFALVGFSLPNFCWASSDLRLRPALRWLPLGLRAIAGRRRQCEVADPARAHAGHALAALVTRQLRSGMLEVLRQDYVRTAQAKGSARGGRQARPQNALIAVVTVVGLQIGGLLGNTIITESLFALPGVGRLMIDAVFSRDFFIVQASCCSSPSVRRVNLIVDVLYSYLDPASGR